MNYSQNISKIFPILDNDALIFSVLVVVGIVAVLLMHWLYSILNGWLMDIFRKYTPMGPKIEKRIHRFAVFYSILFPIDCVANCIWIKMILNKGVVMGVTLGPGATVFCFLMHSMVIIGLFRITNFFHKSYLLKKDNAKSPIRATIIFVYTLLSMLTAVIMISFVSKERPIVVLSTFGASVALFAFAFQNILTSMVARVQVNTENMARVGDWIVIKSKDIDGIVELVSSQTMKVRNWDHTVVSLPIRMLMEEPLVNYTPMFASGGRMIQRSILIDQRTVRFLTPEEVEELKKTGLVQEDMLKMDDSFDETGKISGQHLWTNIELFNLYAEAYLRRNPNIRHDTFCFMRSKAPTPTGIPLELYCFSAKTSFEDFEDVQRSVIYHLLAVLSSFRLRVFQECSDIRQQVDSIPDCIGGVFRADRLQNPVCSVNSKPSGN